MSGLGSLLLRHTLLQDVQRLVGRQAGLCVALYPLLGAGRLLLELLLEPGRLLELRRNRLGRPGLEAGLSDGLLLELGLVNGVGLLPQLADLLSGLGSDLGDLLQFLGVKGLFLRHVLELGPDVRIHLRRLQLLGHLLIGTLRLLQLLTHGANLIQFGFDSGDHLMHVRYLLQ